MAPGVGSARLKWPPTRSRCAPLKNPRARRPSEGYVMRLRLESRGHAELVQSAVRGCLSVLVIDEAVRCSWNRCLTSYALDAVRPKKPTTVERSELLARKERLGSLLSIAKIEMAGLARLMQHSQYGIMLTDWDGVIVSY